MQNQPANFHGRTGRSARWALQCLGGFVLTAGLPLFVQAQPNSGAAELLAQAAPPSATGTAITSGAPQSIPVNVQGIASLGLTVRVKDVLIGSDATILNVGISFSSRMTHSTDLASTNTFLELANGDRLPIKRPDDNRHLSIRDGQTMQGQLVFLGALPPTAAGVKLVFNDGNDADDAIGPGLQITVPLKMPEKK